MAKKAKKRKPTPAQVAYYNRNKGRKKSAKEAAKPSGKKAYATALLNTREATHGDYGVNAGIAQAVKAVFHQTPEFAKLDATQKESAELIATKFGRLISGDPNCIEHWEDIAGYAMLQVERLRAAAEAAQ